MTVVAAVLAAVFAAVPNAPLPNAGVQARGSDAAWAADAASSVRAALGSAGDARAWAGLAAALGQRSAAPGQPEPAALARAVADSLAGRAGTLADIVISSDAAASRITLHGEFAAGAVELAVDDQDPTRVVISIADGRSALAWDRFAAVDVAGVKSLLVLRQTGVLRIVIRLHAPYAAAAYDEAGAAVITLAHAPLAIAPWSARAQPRRLSAAAPPASALPGKPVAAAAIDAGIAAAGGIARTLHDVATRTARMVAAETGVLLQATPRVSVPFAAFSVPVVPAAAALLLTLVGAGFAVRRRRLARAAPAEPGAGRSRRPRGRIPAARALLARGTEPLDVARRTHLSRDAIRIIAARA